MRLGLADKVVHLQIARQFAAQYTCAHVFNFEISVLHGVTRAEIADVRAHRGSDHLQVSAAEASVNHDEGQQRSIRLGLILHRAVCAQYAKRQGSVLQSSANLSGIEHCLVGCVKARMHEIRKRGVQNELRVAAVQGGIAQLELLRSDVELRGKVMRNGVEVLEVQVPILVTQSP